MLSVLQPDCPLQLPASNHSSVSRHSISLEVWHHLFEILDLSVANPTVHLPGELPVEIAETVKHDKIAHGHWLVQNCATQPAYAVRADRQRRGAVLRDRAATPDLRPHRRQVCVTQEMNDRRCNNISRQCYHLGNR